MVQLFNACEYLLDRRLAAGDAPRIALTGGAGDLSYAGLHDQVCRTAGGLRSLGLQPEQRVLMLMADSPQFVVVYLAAMRIGAIPVPVSTMLHADGVAELLRDSRARFLAVTHEFGPVAIGAATAAPELTGILAEAGLSQRLQLPHVAFNRKVGAFSGIEASPDGELLSADEWAQRSGQWLPTDVDKTHVRSLMQPVHERGKIAAWIAPPRNGINGKPFDYDYVHLA